MRKIIKAWMSGKAAKKGGIHTSNGWLHYNGTIAGFTYRSPKNDRRCYAILAVLDDPLEQEMTRLLKGKDFGVHSSLYPLWGHFEKMKAMKKIPYWLIAQINQFLTGRDGYGYFRSGGDYLTGINSDENAMVSLNRDKTNRLTELLADMDRKNVKKYRYLAHDGGDASFIIENTRLVRTGYWGWWGTNSLDEFIFLKMTNLDVIEV